MNNTLAPINIVIKLIINITRYILKLICNFPTLLYTYNTDTISPTVASNEYDDTVKLIYGKIIIPPNSKRICMIY